MEHISADELHNRCRWCDLVDHTHEERFHVGKRLWPDGRWRSDGP